MTDNLISNVPRGGVEDVSDEHRHAAVRRVASLADNAEDLAEVLAALGLTAQEGK